VRAGEIRGGEGAYHRPSLSFAFRGIEIVAMLTCMSPVRVDGIYAQADSFCGVFWHWRGGGGRVFIQSAAFRDPKPPRQCQNTPKKLSAVSAYRTYLHHWYPCYRSYESFLYVNDPCLLQYHLTMSPSQVLKFGRVQKSNSASWVISTRARSTHRILLPKDVLDARNPTMISFVSSKKKKHIRDDPLKLREQESCRILPPT